MSLNIDTNGILPVKVSGASPKSLSRSLTLPQSCNCERGVDVVGVVTPLVREVAQVLHGDQVVEFSGQLAVQEVEGKEEDREAGGSRRGETTEGGALLDDYGDEMT